MKYYIEEVDGKRLESGWRGGVDRLYGGSYNGTQSQERWHGSRLRPTLGHLRRPVNEVVDGLAKLCKSRLEQFQLQDQKLLYQFPCGTWSRKLQKEAQVYLNDPSLVFTESDPRDGSSFCLMRASVTDASMVRTVCIR